MPDNQDDKYKDLSLTVSLSNQEDNLPERQDSGSLVVVDDDENELSTETDSPGNDFGNDDTYIEDEPSNYDIEEEYYSDAYVDASKAEGARGLIAKIESKVDWNLISISAIWIFLTLTFFGIVL